MTYRSDHEAALARVDALEAENARLVEKIDDLKIKKPFDGAPLYLTGLIALGVAVFGGTLIGARTSDESHASPVRAEKVITAPLEVKPPNDVELCARVLASKPTDHDMKNDPRREWLFPKSVFRADCHSEVAARLANASITLDERIALERWRDAEDALFREALVLEKHYTSAPKEDATLIWRKYDRAFDEREQAIEAWRRREVRDDVSQ